MSGRITHEWLNGSFHNLLYSHINISIISTAKSDSEKKKKIRKQITENIYNTNAYVSDKLISQTDFLLITIII